MIRCKILVEAPYADYQGSGTNRKAVVHAEGKIVLFPINYAVRLQDMDMVEILSETSTTGSELDGVAEVEVIEIDEPDQVEEVEPPDATESAIEFAADNQIDLTRVEGTLPEGRISLADVRRYQSDAG